MSGQALRVPDIDSGKWYTSQAAEEVVQVRTGRGLFWSLYATNTSGSTRYVWVFDNTASSGTVVTGPFPIAAGQALGMDLRYGIPFENGLRVAASSTHATFTATAANDMRYSVGYGVNARRKDGNN